MREPKDSAPLIESVEDNDMNEGAQIVHRIARQWAGTDLVSVALIALEAGESVEQVAQRLGEAVQLDDIGMRAVPTVAAREFFAARAEQEARMRDQSDRMQEEAARSLRPAPAGVPAREGMSAHETMMAAPDYETVGQAFGRPAPTFLDDMLAEGRQREAEARAKAEAVKRVRRDLEGAKDR